MCRGTRGDMIEVYKNCKWSFMMRIIQLDFRSRVMIRHREWTEIIYGIVCQRQWYMHPVLTHLRGYCWVSFDIIEAFCMTEDVISPESELESKIIDYKQIQRRLPLHLIDRLSHFRVFISFFSTRKNCLFHRSNKLILEATARANSVFFCSQLTRMGA